MPRRRTHHGPLPHGLPHLTAERTYTRQLRAYVRQLRAYIAARLAVYLRADGYALDQRDPDDIWDEDVLDQIRREAAERRRADRIMATRRAIRMIQAEIEDGEGPRPPITAAVGIAAGVVRAGSQAERRMIRQVTPRASTRLAAPPDPDDAARPVVAAIRSGLRPIDIAPSSAEQEVLAGWASENADLIRTIPRDLLAGLDDDIARAVRRGDTVDMIQILTRRGGIEERHARLIARDQVGKLNGKIGEKIQANAGIVVYRWRTMRDAAVREEHQAMEGALVRWDTPPEGTGPYGEAAHPGQAIQCRCYAEPVELADLTDAELQALGFSPADLPGAQTDPSVGF